MVNPLPSKTFRGSVEEVFSHRDEIPEDAILELKVFEPIHKADAEEGDFGGKSIADLIREIGLVEGLPSDLSTNPRHMEGFGETNDRRAI